MSPSGIMFWTKCTGILDGFMAVKEDSSLKLAELVPIKARDPFL